MRDVVWLRAGFPPFRRLCRLSTANNVDRSFHIMDAGQAVVELAASDPDIAEVTEGRIVEIQGYRRIKCGIPENEVAVAGSYVCFSDGTKRHRAQAFRTPRTGGGQFTAVSLSLLKVLAPTGTLHLHLYSNAVATDKPDTALATSTNTINCADLTTSAEWYSFTFAPFPLSSNTTYHWVLDVDDAVQDNANYVRVAYSLAGYNFSGNRAYSADKITWSSSSTNDFLCRFICDWYREVQAVAPWIGWIDQLGDEDDTGVVTVDCVDAATKLGERHSGLTTARSGCAGGIARDLLYECNSRNGLGIIWDPNSEVGMPVANIDVSGSSVLDALNKLADATGDEWWFEYVIAPDQLKIMLHWGWQQGFDLSGRVCLRDGYGISSFGYSRDAIEEAESVLVVGSGGTMNERPGVVRAVNQPERAALSGVPVQGASQTQRLRQVSEPALAAERVIVAPRESDIGVLARIAERDLEATWGALETVSMTINENVDWATVPVGSIVRVIHDTAWGTLDRHIRVMEMQPGDGICDLAVQVLND